MFFTDTIKTTIVTVNLQDQKSKQGLYKFFSHSLFLTVAPLQLIAIQDGKNFRYRVSDFSILVGTSAADLT
jgi:hypothetical protein